MASNDKRIQAALHYAIGKKCENTSQQNGMTYSKGFTAVLAETVFEVGELFAKDMEAFAKHGKRSVVSIEDVKLLCRRNPDLKEKLEKCLDGNNTEKLNKQKHKKRKSEVVADEDFENDL